MMGILYNLLGNALNIFFKVFFLKPACLPAGLSAYLSVCLPGPQHLSSSAKLPHKYCHFSFGFCHGAKAPGEQGDQNEQKVYGILNPVM